MGEPYPKNSASSASAPHTVRESLPMQAVEQAVSSIQFGVVQIIIQNGRIVQIEKTEKIRLV